MKTRVYSTDYIITTIRHHGNTRRFLCDLHEMKSIGFSSFRINLDKLNDYRELECILKDLKCFRGKYGENSIKIMLDLPFPKCKPRLKTRNDIPFELRTGDKIIISSCVNEYSDVKGLIIGISVEMIGSKLELNQVISYSNGEGTLQVTKIIDDDSVEVKVINSFVLRSKSALSFGRTQTNNDEMKRIVSYIHALKPDSIAFSFIESADDVFKCRKMFEPLNCTFISKIETVSGVRNIRDISDVSDAIMIARGDLGLYMEISKLPFAQEYISQVAKEKNIILYIATDILPSLVQRNIPSRPDINDVQSIIKCEPDGVILSYNLLNAKKVHQAHEIIMNVTKNSVIPLAELFNEV